MNDEMIHNLCALRLKEALNDNSLRPIDLAERTGLSKYTISHYYTGKRVPTRDNAELIAKVLCVNPVWLMGFNVDKYHKEGTPASEQDLLLAYFAQLSPDQQSSVLNLIKNMV